MVPDEPSELIRTAWTIQLVPSNLSQVSAAVPSSPTATATSLASSPAAPTSERFATGPTDPSAPKAADSTESAAVDVLSQATTAEPLARAAITGSVAFAEAPEMVATGP